MSFLFKTISKSGESLHKVKGSKHFGFCLAVRDEEEIGEALANIQKQHHSGRHVCYAWRLGADQSRYRANDDGEPANSAGMPILGQIEKYDLTNVLVAVVRYFGGTKLGVGGLIDAYRTAAQMAIDDAEIVEKQLMAHFQLHFGYDMLGDVTRILRMYGWEGYDQNFRESCSLKIQLLPQEQETMEGLFQAFTDLRTQSLGIY